MTIDKAIRGIIQLGQGTLLAKIDIQSVFRLIPVHPADRQHARHEMERWSVHRHLLPFWVAVSPQAVQYHVRIFGLDCQAKRGVIPNPLFR